MRSFNYLKHASEQRFPEDVINAIKYTGANPYKTHAEVPYNVLYPNNSIRIPVISDMLDPYLPEPKQELVKVPALGIRLSDYNKNSQVFLNRYKKFKKASPTFNPEPGRILALSPLFHNYGRKVSPYINDFHHVVMTNGRPFSDSSSGIAALNPAFTGEGTGAVHEEGYQHYINVPAIDYNIIPQGLGGDEGAEALEETKYGQSYSSGARNYVQNKWAYPKGHPANIDLQKQAMTWKPSAYSLRAAEFTKSLGMIKDKLERDHNAKFNSFSDVLPYLRKNGFYKGGRIDESKLMRKEYGSSYSPLYGEIFGLQRDLSDGLRLAKAAYRRDPKNLIAKRNYEHSKLMHDRYMKEADHYWDQLHTSSMSKKQ